MDWRTFWEVASYVVTVVGLPLAIVIFKIEKRKQRANEEAEIQQLLSDSYTDFLKIVLANPDLRLLGASRTPDLTEEKKERIRAIFSILIALFERAFILTYDPKATGRRLREWRSWDDIMREWCRRDDFASMLPDLLIGEDEAFAHHISTMARQEHASRGSDTLSF